MAKRYSGRLVVSVSFDDRRDSYKASVSEYGHTVWSGRINAPRSGGGAVDSPLAYDGAARAALSFASNEAVDISGASWTDRGVHVGRSLATRFAKQENPSRKRKAPSKTKASATYVVAIFDPEAGHFVRHSRMKGTTARDVERRVMAKWGLDSDDVKVIKAPAKKRR